MSPARQVLVVDDEPGMRLVLGRALARLGYRVLLADTVDGGIAQLAAHPHLDAVLADVTTPILTGLDFAAAVIEHHPGVPILFLTGGPTASGALDDPLIGLVAKPVAIGDLQTQLAQLIDRADQIATTTATPATPAQQAAAGGGAVIGHRGRRIEPGGRLAVLPELDHTTATWAAVAGLTGMAGPPAGPRTALSAVPGAGESTRLASLGLFAAGVANEVNNMLAVVTMRAELLADGADGHQPTPTAAEDITAITAAAARAAQLVQQLMLFAGQRTLDRGPVDVAELVEDMRSRLDEVAGAPGLITCSTTPVPAVTADHEHLERAVLNLVRNALEATAPPVEQAAGAAAADGRRTPGRPRVRVRVAPSAPGPDGPGVVLEVTDAGRGMTAEVRDRATEPFFRAYTSDGGSGLGLAIVYGIITQHAGRLAIDSTPGRGTTVRVTLPADPAAIPAAAAT